MIKINKHKLTSDKINKNIKILLIADIHIWDDYDWNLLDKIVSNVNKLKPDVICLCGDLIDQFSFITNDENRKKILSFFNKLSGIATTLITLGSHDFFNHKKFKSGNISSDAIVYWKKIIKNNNNKNLILLDNQIYEQDDFKVIGYTQSRDYYHLYEDPNILINELNCNFKQNIVDNKFTILMAHSPKNFNKKILKKIELSNSIDIILSGHMHNGLVFPIFEKLPTNIGFIGADKEIFPNNARGLKKIKINNKIINLIITGGIIKFSNTAPKFLRKINFLYNNNIDYIEIFPIKK